MIRPARRLCTVLVGAALVACNGSTDLVTGELTSAEAAEVAAATMFATFNSTSVLPPRPTPSATAGASAGWALDFEAEVRCPRGGMVVLAASLVAEEDPVSGEGRAEYRLAEVHESCGAGPSGPTPFRVSGAPRIGARVTVDHDGAGGVAWTGASEGSVRWVRDGRTGVCAFSVAFSGRKPTAKPGSAVLVGELCGLALSDSMTIG